MDIRVSIEDPGWQELPDAEAVVTRAVAAALCAAGHDASRDEVSVVLAGDAEVAALNAQWRNKQRPTNVLSFPAARPAAVPAGAILPLGDLILAYGVVAREADAQGKTLAQHVSHLVIHGILHLLGYDHVDEGEADRMELKEVAALELLGLKNPYEAHAAAGGNTGGAAVD